MRQVDRHHVNAVWREQRAQLPDPLTIRAISTPNGQRVLIEPQRVASLDGPRRLDPSDDRDSQLRVRLFSEIDLVQSQLLAGTQQRGAGVGHQGWVVGEDGIEQSRFIRAGDDNLGATRGEKPAKCVVLALRSIVVDGPRIAEVREVLLRRRGCRLAHQHPFQRGDHALATPGAAGRSSRFRHERCHVW